MSSKGPYNPEFGKTNPYVFGTNLDLISSDMASMGQIFPQQHKKLQALEIVEALMLEIQEATFALASSERYFVFDTFIAPEDADHAWTPKEVEDMKKDVETRQSHLTMLRVQLGEAIAECEDNYECRIGSVSQLRRFIAEEKANKSAALFSRPKWIQERVRNEQGAEPISKAVDMMGQVVGHKRARERALKAEEVKRERKGEGEES